MQRRYDPLGLSDEVIMPHVWDEIVEPSWDITLKSWPSLEPEPEPPPPLDDTILTLDKDPITRPIVQRGGELIIWYDVDRRVVMYPASDNELLNFVRIHPEAESDGTGDWNTQANESKSLDVPQLCLILMDRHSCFSLLILHGKVRSRASHKCHPRVHSRGHSRRSSHKPSRIQM